MKTTRVIVAAIITALILAALFVKIPSQFAQTVTLDGAALWVATIGQLLKVDPTDGSTDAQPPDTQNQLRLAADDTRQILWSYSRGTLSAFDSLGNLVAKAAVPPPASATTNLALVVNSMDSSVWLAIQKLLHHFNAQGQLLKTIDLPAQAQDLSFDPESGQLWVATQSTVTALNATGATVKSLFLPKNQNVQAIAVDRLSGALWVALPTSLRLYSATGAVISEKSVTGIDQLSDDGDHGVWASAGARLLRLSATQQILVNQFPAGQGTPLTATVGDRSDHSVWLTGEKTLFHFDSVGRALLSKTLGSNTNDLALVIPPPPLNRPPTITSTPVTSATVGVLYSYAVKATDPDLGDKLTFSLPFFPAGMTIDPSSGSIQWTPTAGQVGQQSVTVRVTDAGGLFATQTYTVTVAPGLTTVPNVVGLTVAAAEVALSNAVLVLGTVTEVSSDTVPAGQIVNQTPSPGTLAVRSSAVNVVVSTGPLAPTIVGFTPTSGKLGTVVTINGTKFSAVSSVRFNGVAASGFKVMSPTSIVATVPLGATTGPLAVTASLNTATSTGHFIVVPTQDFDLSVSPALAQTVAGSSASYSVRITNTGNGNFTGLASLTTGALPTGVSAIFTPPNLTSNSAGILKLTTTSSTPVGSHSVEVRASAQIGGQTVQRTATIALSVQAPGQTLLVGEVHDENDLPLSGISIKLGGAALTHLGFTDAGGNFFIPLTLTGKQVFLIDGSTANTSEFTYSTVPITLDVQPGVVNSIGYIPKLHAQAVAKLTPITPNQDTILTDAEIPGFKMIIAAGVQIIGWDNQPNTRVGVRAIPIDRSPLPPIPPDQGSRVIYLFNFGKVGGGQPTGNIPIDTPNDVGGVPGDPIDLYYFNEAPDGSAPNRWEKYGTGKVSSDGTQIITDVNLATGLPYGIPRFCCGARRNGAPQSTPPDGPNGGQSGAGAMAGEPVDVGTGFFYLEKTDMVLSGITPIAMTRTYRSNLTNVGPFGVGTSSPYDLFLRPTELSPDALILFTPGNRQDLFARQPDGSFVNTTSPPLRGAVVTAQGSNRLLTFKNKIVWTFDAGGRLIAQTDRNGNTVTIVRDSRGRVTQLIEPAGRTLTMDYTGGSLRIDSIRDPLSRTVSYLYDEQGRLSRVHGPDGGSTQYTYDEFDRMTSITDARGITYLRNEYDSAGRVSRQTQADGGVWSFIYEATGVPPNSFIVETLVRDPRGNFTTYHFNSAGYLVRQTDSLGQTTKYEREPGTNLILTAQDALGRKTSFAYDANGNATQTTDPDGKKWNFQYEPTFNRVTKIFDPLENSREFQYDSHGNVVKIVDPLHKETNLVYNEFGQPLTFTDALGNVIRLSYDSVGNLAAIIDPLGNTTKRDYDQASRLIAQTDPRGSTTRYVYDAHNRTKQITDAIGANTRFEYDPNGNVLAVTDARNNSTTYTYDSMDRVATRTDALGATEFFQYDGSDNLTVHTDRKGQVNTFQYDKLNRPVGANYADGSTINLVYDPVGRLVQGTDSIGGIILNSYDNLDRLVSQSTDLGTIQYAYDPIGRRNQMIVGGQPPVFYTHDQASRLRTISQTPLNPVQIEYDDIGRRTKLTLPNNVSTNYSYDGASRITELAYRNADGLLGNLTYQYDAGGNRTKIGGSFARTLLPDPVASANYDSANRQLAFGNKSMSFDPNGNLASIIEPTGSTNFTWDARNRLLTLASPISTGIFGYDSLGRRVSKQINGVRTQFSYDGANPVQETSGATVLANILTGFGIDEFLRRTDVAAGTTNHFLLDGLRSAMALTDSAGAVQTEYSYEPFGKTATTGVSSANSFQYTGRENDSTGLYYYRNRYYHPGLQRFASEDPIGLGGGQINLYGYVGNSPTRFSDPRGLTSLAVKLVGKLAGGVSVSLLRFYDPRSSTSLPVQILDRGINLAADVFTTGDDSACGGIYDGAPRDTSKRKPPNYSSPLSRRCHEHDVELAGRGTSFRDPGNFDINLHLGFGAWRAGQHVFGAFFVLGGLAQGAWELANVGELLDYISDVWTEISPD